MLPAPATGPSTPAGQGRNSSPRRYNWLAMTPPAAAKPPPEDSARVVREEEVRDCLRAVVDPELGDTIVDLGMVRAIGVEGDDVTVDVALTIASCPLRGQIEQDVTNHVGPWTGCARSTCRWRPWRRRSGPR